jgi:hypothetical protein
MAHAQQVLVQNGATGGRSPGVEEHPGVPAAETPRLAQASPRLRIGDVLVEEALELATTVLFEAPADGTSVTVARVDEAKVADELFGHSPPRWT